MEKLHSRLRLHVYTFLPLLEILACQAVSRRCQLPPEFHNQLWQWIYKRDWILTGREEYGLPDCKTDLERIQSCTRTRHAWAKRQWTRVPLHVDNLNASRIAIVPLSIPIAVMVSGYTILSMPLPSRPESKQMKPICTMIDGSRPFDVIGGYPDKISCPMVVLPSTGQLLTGSWNGTIRLWQFPQHTVVREYRGLDSAIRFIYSDGKTLVAGYGFVDWVGIWDLRISFLANINNSWICPLNHGQSIKS